MDALVDLRVGLQMLDGQGDELAEGEELVLPEHLPVGGVALPNLRAFEAARRDQLVGDDVDGPHEVANGLPVLRAAQLVKPQPPVLAAEKARVAVVVEDIVVAVCGDVSLQEPEAVAVDRSDEHRAEAVEEGLTHPLGHPPGSSLLQLGSGSLREGEGDDRVRPGARLDQLGDPPGDRLRLARARTRNDLRVLRLAVDRVGPHL